MYRRGIRYFLLKAEDGIRDYKVTGVQTCDLPILSRRWRMSAEAAIFVRTSEIVGFAPSFASSTSCSRSATARLMRSEERRVGEERGRDRRGNRENRQPALDSEGGCSALQSRGNTR